MNEWTRCPHCGLRHSVRRDGLCPRCRYAGDAAVAAADLAAAAASSFGGKPGDSGSRPAIPIQRP